MKRRAHPCTGPEAREKSGKGGEGFTLFRIKTEWKEEGKVGLM